MIGLSPLLCVVALLGATPPNTDEAPAHPDVLSALRPTPGGLTFKSVAERAIVASSVTERARIVARRGRERKRTAYLGFVPRVDLNASYTRLSEVELPPFRIGVIPGSDTDAASNPFLQVLDNYLLQASIDVPVTEYFLTIIHGYRAARLDQDITSLQERSERQRVALSAIDAMIGLVRARATRMVAARSVDVLAAHLVDMQQLVSAGISLDADRLQVEAQLAGAKVSLSNADGAVGVREAVLRLMLRAPPVGPLRHAEDLIVDDGPQPASLTDAVAAATSSRFEIKALAKMVTAREAMLKFYTGGRYPKLSARGAARYANPNQRVFPLQTRFDATWDVTLNLSWSPNDYVVANSQVNDANRDLDVARSDLAGLIDAVTIESTQALAAYRTARRSIASAQDALTAAEGSFSERKLIVAAGESTTTALLDAEATLRRAQLTLVNAYLDARLARASLDRAMGRAIEGTGDES